MSGTIGKIFKIFLYLLILLILGALIAWLVIFKGWPWWVGAAIFIGVIGLWIAILFVRKYFLRRREREFVRRVIAHDEASIQAAAPADREQLQELQTQWAKAIERLKSSHLRARGNPLYVLPWFLIIGESGAGKSSALKNARLTSPLSESGRTMGVTGTRNCEWWFFDQAIVIDTAGRYTIPLDEGRDREEWEQFLTLLAQYRRREPVNGIIVAVSAEKLLSASEAVLREDGQDVRKRIDQLMRSLGARIPVFILVTKVDLVHGLADLCRVLPAEARDQAMGYLNDKLNPNWGEVLEMAFHSATARLKQLRQLMVHQQVGLLPGGFLAPDEFGQLKPGLGAFIRPVFESNSYQESPILRGVHFSSARQGDVPRSRFLQQLGLTPPAAAANESQSLFLVDFFRKILPHDRNLFRPLADFLRWRRLTTSLGLIAWLFVWCCLGGLLNFVFYKNIQVFNGFTDEFVHPPALSGDISTDLLMLDRFRLEVEEMDQANENWWIPRFGLTQSLWMEDRVRESYCRQFRSGIMIPLDEELSKRFESVTPSTSEDLTADYVGFMVTRINLIQDYLAGRHVSQMKQFKKISINLLTDIHPQLPDEIAARFGDTYHAQLVWFGDATGGREKLAILRDELVALLNRKGGDLKWLVRKWIPGVSNVRLVDFWGEPETPYPPGQAWVPGAYTAKGRENIQEFLTQVDSAMGDPAALAESKSFFWDWYWDEYYDSWSSFALCFHDGMAGLKSVTGWEQMGTKMTSNFNPYFNLIDRMGEEFDAADMERQPAWARLTREVAAVHQLAVSELEKQKTKKSLTDMIKGEEEKILRKIQAADKAKTQQLEKRLHLAKIWEDYVAALEKISPAATSREASFHQCSDYFPFHTQPPATPSPFQTGFNDVYSISGILSDVSDAPFIWDLVSGPLRFMVDYTVMETACVLQAQWKEQVLGGIQGAHPDKLPQLLFDKTDGLLWKYLDGVAAPFVTKTKTGYAPRVAFEKTVPFQPEFFELINTGATGLIDYQPEYIVTLDTVPIDVNEGAKTEAYAAVLCLQCADAKTCLENYNYPQSMTFKWDPDKCGDVTLNILFPGFNLSRAYKGKMGFARFLSDFRDGTRTFRAEEFPESQESLKNQKITWIKLTYRVTGGNAVIQLLNRAPTRVPSEIVSCWSP